MIVDSSSCWVQMTAAGEEGDGRAVDTRRSSSGLASSAVCP